MFLIYIFYLLTLLCQWEGFFGGVVGLLCLTYYQWYVSMNIKFPKSCKLYDLLWLVQSGVHTIFQRVTHCIIEISWNGYAALAYHVLHCISFVSGLDKQILNDILLVSGLKKQVLK